MSKEQYPYPIILESPFCTPADGEWGYNLEKPARDIIQKMCIRDEDYWWDCWYMRFKKQSHALLFSSMVVAYYENNAID